MSKESCQIAATDIGLGRKQLESTVALSKGLMCVKNEPKLVNVIHELSRLRHLNVLRIEGISSSASLMHFIAYESGTSRKICINFIAVYWKNIQGPLADALKNDLSRSITLGSKMV
jgi:hypothetical protein